MRSVVLAGLRTHTRRYVAALLAVVLGTAFIVVTAGLSSAARDGLVRGIAEPYDGADAVLEWVSPSDADDLIAAASRGDAQAWVIGSTRQPVATDSDVFSSDASVAQVPDAPQRRWQELVGGRFPAEPGEALVDAGDAQSAGVEIGDRIRVGSGADALEVSVVGTAESPSMLTDASVYLLWDDLRRWQDSLAIEALAWSAGGDHDRAVAQIRDVVRGAAPITAEELVDRIHAEINDDVDIIAAMVLVFASVALVVAVLVVANTFSILFAQRTREFALLRCVGATRRQVVRSVRVEALVIGLLAAALGVSVGVLAAHGLVAVIGARWPDAGFGTPTIAVEWLVGAAALAVALTVVAAWLPTRRVLRIGPLAALGPDDSTSTRTTAGRLRLGLGVLSGAAGVAAMAVGMAGHAVPAMIVGGTLTFAGVLLWGPVLVPALIRLLLRATDRLLGPAGRLAGANAVRNPRRTAATTASLLIGVTLTTAVLTGIASSRTAVADDQDTSHPIDYTLTAARDLPDDVTDNPADDLADDLVQAVAVVDGVAHVVPIPGVGVRLGERLQVTALAPEDRSSDLRPVIAGRPVPLPEPGTIVVDWSLLDGRITDGSRVEVSAGAGARTSVRLRVVGGSGFGEVALLAPDDLQTLAPAAGTRAVWLRGDGDADGQEIADRLEALAGPAEATVTTDLVDRQYVDLQLDVLTAGVVGLLGIALLIALIGIANTLGLSVAERAREHALLRALGLTRRRLRIVLAGEATWLSVVATLLGTGLGVLFAWVGVRTLVAIAVEDPGLTVPWAQLGVLLAASAAAGVLAAVLPARRAARIAPAAGLALE